MTFTFLIDRKIGKKHYWSFEQEWMETGLRDDLAVGPPFDIRSINSDNTSKSMIDAMRILELRKRDYLDRSIKTGRLSGR